jgi:hypothetical protein
MPRKTLSSLLLAAATLFVVLALATLMPYRASMNSDLGYSALCPFAPWSTLMLFFLGGASWLVRRHIDAQPA